MSDPAVEAAKRAMARDGHAVDRDERVPITAANEALAPVREWYENNAHRIMAGHSVALDDLERLLYPREDA